MNDFQRRPKPIFGVPAEQSADAEDTAQPRPLQLPAAAGQADRNFKVSIEEIRMRLHRVGVEKSKDTLWRYCREGRLNADRLGILKRWYATETSVQKLVDDEQLHAAVNDEVQLSAAAEAKIQLHETATGAKNLKFLDLHAAAKPTVENPAAATVGEIPKDFARETVVAVGEEGLLVTELRSRLEDKDKELARVWGQLETANGNIGILSDAVTGLKQVISAFEKNAEATLTQAENEKRKMDEQGNGTTPQKVHVVAAE